MHARFLLENILNVTIGETLLLIVQWWLESKYSWTPGVLVNVPSALYLFSFQATEALSQLPLHALDLELVQDVASKWQLPSKIHVAHIQSPNGCCISLQMRFLLRLSMQFFDSANWKSNFSHKALKFPRSLLPFAKSNSCWATWSNA